MTLTNAIRRDGARLAAVVAGLLAVFALPAHAVLIQTASGTGNTTAPADDPGFANIGYTTTGLGTGIYLGGGWVLTAAHVAGDGIVLASGTYLQASGSNTSFALVNDTPGKSYQTDLYMFKLATEPAGLPSIPIASSMPALGDAVTMIGGGRDRGAFTQWTVNQATTPWTWTVTGSGGNAAGYGTLGTRAIRWGTNNVEVNDFWVNDGFDVKSFATSFDDAPGTSEAQAVLNDSGGAVFTKVGGQWQLAGIIYSVAGYSGQPDPIYTAVFGDATLMADLSFYRPQIVAVVPEPAGLVLAAGAAVMLAWHAAGRWPRPRRRRTMTGTGRSKSWTPHA